MPKDLWTSVDRYFADLLLPPDRALQATLEASENAGLPSINVTPNQGKLLYLLAQIQGARKILEIGTLAGYSTIWLARALPPDGRLITLEFDPKHAKIAQQNLTNAGVADKVEIRIGRAVDSLAGLCAQGLGPFDLFFIDADKPSNPDYFTWALRLSRIGSVMIIDNVVREGAVADTQSTDPGVIGVRHMTQLIAAEPRVTATTIQTVGPKGYDGLMLVRVIR